MKTITRIHNLIPGLVCLWFALTSVSCQTTSSPPKTTRIPMSMTATKWVKVSAQPPTYYPCGVAADCPTDHWSGEWVETGDDQGTRYFIPLHGLGKKRDVLVREALSARSARKLAQVEAEDQEILSRNVRNAALLAPPAFVGIIVFSWATMGYGTVDDFYHLGRDWREVTKSAVRHGW
jgi:hypothetical protein